MGYEISIARGEGKDKRVWVSKEMRCISYRFMLK